MSNLTAVLISEHLPGGDEALPTLSERTDIPLERLVELERGGNPRMAEVARLAEGLNIDPIHLFRRAPSLKARRSGDGDGGQLPVFLDEVDSFLATYAPDLRPTVDEAFSATRYDHARAAGRGWAERHGVRDLTPNHDPLLSAVEEDLNIPVFIWPIEDAPAGVTVDFSGTLGIWVNSHDQSGARQRFTLAHEVAHILLKHVDSGSGAVVVDFKTDIDTPQSRDEKLAGACASAILVDSDTVRSVWGDQGGMAEAAKIAAALGISYSATLVTLMRQGLIDTGEFERLSRIRARDAFSEADELETYERYECQRGQRRMSDLLPNGEWLETALAERL